MRKLLILITATLCSGMVLAKDTTIFSCTATNGKAITVKKIGNDYQFNYDKVSFKNSAKQVLANKASEIAGGSEFITYTLQMKNKGMSYIIGSNQPRNNPKVFDNAGFSVSSDDGSFNEVFCDQKKPIVQTFEVNAMKKFGI